MHTAGVAAATLWAACLLAVPLRAEVSGTAEDETTPYIRDREIIQQLREINRTIRRLGDWEAQAEVITRVQDALWRRNGWDSEADRFALEVAQQIARIPPWQIEARWQYAIDALTRRYRLTPEQQEYVTRLLIEEANEVVRQYAPAMFPIGWEALRTRLAGRPFTPEQVARWTRQLAPMLEDMERRTARLAQQFREVLTEEQQATLDRDLAALDRRMDFVRQGWQRWQQGRWDPREWALDLDPIHQQALNGDAGQEHVLAAATQPAGGMADTVLDAWERYVREFIARYDLDEAQQTSAWAYLRDARDAAQRLRIRYSDPRHADLLRQRLEGEFQRLKQRLDLLPTEAQREQAESRETPIKPR